MENMSWSKIATSISVFPDHMGENTRNFNTSTQADVCYIYQLKISFSSVINYIYYIYRNHLPIRIMQAIGPIFKGQKVLTLEDGTDRLPRNVGT
jgi:hypothetical protein